MKQPNTRTFLSLNFYEIALYMTWLRNSQDKDSIFQMLLIVPLFFLWILTIRKYISRKSSALQSLSVSAGLHAASSEFFPNQIKLLFKEKSRPFNSLNIASELVRNVAEHLHKVCVTKCHWKKFLLCHAECNTISFQLHISQVKKGFFKYIDEVRKDSWGRKAPWNRR